MSVQSPQARAPRLPIRLAAEITTPAARINGTTRNLSTGGVCVEVDRLLDEGVEVEVTLLVIEDDVESAGGRTLSLRGTVQWAAESDRGYQVGLRFVSVEPAKLKQLENVLKVIPAEG